MVDKDQLERFGEAVEQKKAAAQAASEQPGKRTPHGSPVDGDQEDLTEHGRPQDTRDERRKSSGKGKMTADKWNQ